MHVAPRRVLSAIALLLATYAAPWPVRAADEPLAVAHVGFVQGNAAILRHGGASAAAAVNEPLMAGDSISTSPGSRVEVQLDAVTVVRLASRTLLRFANLDPGHREMQLSEGTIELRLFRISDSRIDTPAIPVVVEQPGVYRVALTADGRTEVAVRAGRASVVMPGGGTLALLPGHALIAGGSPSNPSIAYSSTVATSDFDAWSDARDLELRNGLASANLDTTLGAGALTSYGRWVDNSAYGTVWAPYVGSGWSPYQAGSWSWTSFGWSWVSSEPWGWAPYHWGQWFYDPAYGWIWAPGTPTVWAPVNNTPVQQQWWGWRARNGGTSIVPNNFTNYTNLNNLYRTSHPNATIGTTTVRFPLTQTQQHPPAPPPPVIVGPQQAPRGAAPAARAAPPPANVPARR